MFTTVRVTSGCGNRGFARLEREGALPRPRAEAREQEEREGPVPERAPDGAPDAILRGDR
jgi:hypothetical protein